MLKSRTARICAALLLLFAILRLGIFGWNRKRVSAKQYERKVDLAQFLLSGKEIPEGWSLGAPGLDRPNPRRGVPLDVVAELPETARPPIDGAVEAIHARYERKADERFHLLVLVLPSKEKAVEAVSLAGASLSSPEWTVRSFAFDDRLVVALAPSSVSPLEFLTPIRKKVEARKAFMARIEKLKVIGNALLKILIDLLVFGFIFIVVLFLAKYVFIIRAIEAS